MVSMVSMLRNVGIAVATLAVVIGDAPAASDVLDRIVAIVGGRVVLLSDVTAAGALGLIPIPGDVGGSGGDEVRQTVNRVLVLEEVERFAGVQADPAAVAARVEAIVGRAGPDLEPLLARTGMDRALLRRLADEQIRIERYLDQRFTGAAQPTDEEVDALVREQGPAWARDDLLGPGTDAPTLARQRLIDARRQQLIREWIASLRRRADITMVGER
jgi:hypothetical protein